MLGLFFPTHTHFERVYKNYATGNTHQIRTKDIFDFQAWCVFYHFMIKYATKEFWYLVKLNRFHNCHMSLMNFFVKLERVVKRNLLSNILWNQLFRYFICKIVTFTNFSVISTLWCREETLKVYLPISRFVRPLADNVNFTK